MSENNSQNSIESTAQLSQEQTQKIEIQKKAKKAFHETLNLLSYNFWSFFWFQIIYKFITFCLGIPLMRKIVSIVLYFNGNSNVTNANVLTMLRYPATWIGLLAILYIAGVMVSIEFSGMIAAAHASDTKKKIRVRDMLVYGIDHCGCVFNIKNLMYLVYIIVVIPFASFTESSTLTQNFAIPGFILEAIEKKWYLQLIYYVGLIALMFLAIRWVYVIPIMNIEKKNFHQATSESAKMTHKHIFHSVIVLAICYGMMYVICAAIGIVIGIVPFGIIHWLDPSVDLISLIEPILITDVVVVYILFVVMILPLVLSRIYVEYKRLKKEEGIELPKYKQPVSLITKYKPVRGIIYICIAIGIYFFLPPRYQEVKLILNNVSSQTMVMAHRGDSTEAPENTLPAFQSAIDHGADAAEMDVQMTKDGTIVVLHDSSIDRTSTGHGNIWEVTYDEIKDLDNGSFFNAGFADTRIPTLEQVIDLCKGKLYLNIEIKRTGHDEGIEQKVVDIIKAKDFVDECDITSMDYDTLVNVRKIDSKIKTVYTTNVILGNVEDLGAADALSVEGTFVSQAFITSMHQNGKEFYVWTINDEDEMQKMINLGANAIITNNPTTCRQIVDEDQPTSVFGVLERLRTGLLGK